MSSTKPVSFSHDTIGMQQMCRGGSARFKSRTVEDQSDGSWRFEEEQGLNSTLDSLRIMNIPPLYCTCLGAEVRIRTLISLPSPATSESGTRQVVREEVVDSTGWPRLSQPTAADVHNNVSSHTVGQAVVWYFVPSPNGRLPQRDHTYILRDKLVPEDEKLQFTLNTIPNSYRLCPQQAT